VAQRNRFSVAWREELDRIKIELDQLRATANEEGAQLENGTRQALQKAKDEIDDTENKLARTDQVARAQFEEFQRTMDKSLRAAREKLDDVRQALSKTNGKGTTATREESEDRD
jgi:hypothetical protein